MRRKFCIARQRAGAYLALLEKLEHYARATKDNAMMGAIVSLYPIERLDPRSQMCIDVILGAITMGDLAALHEWMRESVEAVHRAAMRAARRLAKGG